MAVREIMSAGKHPAGLMAIAVLLTAPGPAHAAGTQAPTRTIEEHIGGALRALGRASLVLASVGYSRSGLWKEALSASRRLVALEGDPSYACVARAAVVWHETEASGVEGRAFGEWLQLRATVRNLELDRNLASAAGGMCREAYRRVTGEMALQLHRTSDLRLDSLERLKVLHAAYQNAAETFRGRGVPTGRPGNSAR